MAFSVSSFLQFGRSENAECGAGAGWKVVDFHSALNVVHLAIQQIPDRLDGVHRDPQSLRQSLCQWLLRPICNVLAAMDAAKRTAVSAILSDSAAASTPFGFLYGAPSLDDAYHLVMDRYLASFDGIGPIDSFPVYTASTDQFLPRPPCFCADVAFPYLLSSFMVYLYTANPQQDTID